MNSVDWPAPAREAAQIGAGRDTEARSDRFVSREVKRKADGYGAIQS